MNPRVRSSAYDLVSFSKPPVAEVALSVQFERDTVDIDALGLFAREVRDALPVRQRQPVAPAMNEIFDAPQHLPSIDFHFEPPTVLPRFWFTSESGVELVQLQHDRLSVNWRQMGPDDEYPRYEELRRRTGELLTLLTNCVDGRPRSEPGPSRVFPNLCEVVYVNPVEARASASSTKHSDLSHVLNRVRGRPRGSFLPDAEDSQLQARWLIPSVGEDMPRGRLYLSATPQVKTPENLPIYMINLTARTIPSSSDHSGVMSALDVGHEWVVLGFRDLTTARMQERWGLSEKGAIG